MNKNEIKKGEIYTSNETNNICMWNERDSEYYIGNKQTMFCRGDGGFHSVTLRNATPEEKHWLNICIEQDKFISYDEAMKTFISEYVELLPEWSVANEFVGEIFSTKKDFYEQFNKFKHISKNDNWEQIIKNNWYPKYFKPSTKEAYDAQFVVKEPEFVLPEKWHIRIKHENERNVYKSFFKNVRPDAGWQFLLGFIYGYYNGIYINASTTDSTEITFEQFKKYVLKETEELSPLKLAAIEHPHLAKIESNAFEILSIVNNITKEQLDLKKDGYFRSKFSSIHLNNVNDKYSIVSVANQEGNVFNIGDCILSTRSKSRNNKTAKIKEFRKSKINDNILAIGDHFYATGVNIDKIEHFIEVEPEFILPERWCVKNTDKIISKYFNEMTNDNFTYNNHENKYLHSESLNNLKLTDFISKGNYQSKTFADFYIRPNYTEITFEQFKKYVLKETEPVIIVQSHKDMLDLKTKGINSIVLPQETLLEQAKRLYPIGTVFNNNNIKQHVTKEHISNGEVRQCGYGEITVNTSCGLYTIYDPIKKLWAEIIGYEPQVGDKFQFIDQNKFNFHSDKTYIITRIVKSENSYCNFKNENGQIAHGSVLLKNIKIIK